ncbi:hypothetical protein [Aequorivita sp. CIP111184]|uniref:hypothetical protein n=1 Tax=Aequorivita sp. CIP111184 TaxID=2211356 RepID=UPI000DBC0B77|nr:hypothetical protein [Aequorivita sp. CIP111184]SRX56173.1 hypothetical protein AEQU1_03203 [Aequorivita sp. CIP111184]
MKKIILLFCAGCTLVNVFGQVGIGTVNPTNSSMLEISSTSDGGTTYKGFMPPRVDVAAQRDLINPSVNDVGLMVFVESIGCLQIWNGTNWENINCLDRIAVEPWINEFHYDNIGADLGEFVEIAGPTGLDLGNYRLLFYNGVDGSVYYGLNLSGIIDNESNNFGALSFSPPSIQNEMEGIALIKRSNGQVIQFISYEGSFTATENLANGMTSIDIVVFEDGTDSAGLSIQLTGTGDFYGDFIWNAPTDDSPGDLNVGQNIN